MKTPHKKDLIAQWAYDTRPILGRFHLWLEDVEVRWTRGSGVAELITDIAFMDGRMERLFAMTGAVTALGTQLFGRYGEGRGLDKANLNLVKKDADAISAYAMSECLWYATRHLPENHALLVCLGEGLMPKGGESPEMGSNPQLGFGRVYARPQVARWLDDRVAHLLNDDSYRWTDFYRDIRTKGLTVWGAAIDTLENTSRFATGEPTGPMTVLHLFDQPLHIAHPYEGYMGTLFLPKQVVAAAEDQAILINFRTPRGLVVKAIELAFPGIKHEHIHVWTLRGKTRAPRIQNLWKAWQDQGVHVIDEGWKLPGGLAAFTDSGTYAPTYLVGSWQESGETHVFLVDGYAASAEAMQAVSLAPMLGLEASLCVFTSKFELPVEQEQNVISLDPYAPDFPERLEERTGMKVDVAKVADYTRMIREATDAGLPTHKAVLGADDFFPEKEWSVLAVSGFMKPDPYTGAAGVEELFPGTYRVTVRLSAPVGEKYITFVLRLMEPPDQGSQVFNPLLNRFLRGEDFENRAVRISDSGRIRNELQTLVSEAIEYLDDGRMRVCFDQIKPEVISYEHQKRLREVLYWYQENHPLWFSWLEVR